MNTAQIIVVKPEYIAQSFEWYIDDELKKNIDEDNRLLLENAKKNYCSGKMSVCSVEMLEKLDVVFLGNDKKIVPSFDDVFIRNPYDTNQFFFGIMCN